MWGQLTAALCGVTVESCRGLQFLGTVETVSGDLAQDSTRKSSLAAQDFLRLLPGPAP